MTYAEAATHEVQEACVRLIGRREKEANDKRETLIKQAMRRSFFRDRTRDEAIAYLKKSAWADPRWNEIGWAEQYFTARARELLSLARINVGPTIKLSPEDAKLLEPHWRY